MAPLFWRDLGNPMAEASSNLLDLTRDLAAAARLGTSAEQVDRLLGEAIDTLGTLVPFDLATVMQLRQEELRVRIARGSLANPKVARHKLRLADFPAIREIIGTSRARAFTEHDHRDGDGDAFDGVLDLPYGHSCMVVPLRGQQGVLGIMTFDRQQCETYPTPVVELADVFGKLLAEVLSYGEQSAMLTRLGDQLREQNRLLREREPGPNDACELLEASRSEAMGRLVTLGRQVAQSDAPVLITGETGTGKEVLANALHGWSSRAGQPLVSLNCAALPPSLIESELFGHVKGAFTGATTTRIGRFRAANGGTLFLDEIGELPVVLQAKLLRALQEGCFEPVGSDRTVRVDVRIVAATNLDLLLAVADGGFRQDLYYRLAVFPLHLPPLRERCEDIPIIAERILGSLATRSGAQPWKLGQRAQRWLGEQSWPGNVRELVNVLERATIVSRGPELELGDEPLFGSPASTASSSSTAERGDEPRAEQLPTLAELERHHIELALDHTGGKLYGAGGAAELLGINPNTLRSRMRKHGLGGARDHRRG